MEFHSSMAMFISEIPVRIQGDKTIRWIRDLTNQTTVRDVILLVLPTCDPKDYSLYISTDRRHRQVLNESSRIYKIVSAFNQQKCARRLLFEIRPTKKRVRFADEIVIQDIQGRCVSNEKSTRQMVETIYIPIEKRLEKLKENFQKTIQQKQENYVKLSSKRSTLSIINKNVCIQTAVIKQISRSSSESGFSSSSSNDDRCFETLV